MAVGRNDPCPCGSGKKYKHCCWRKDRHTRGTNPFSTSAREAARAPEWEIELAAVPIEIEGDPRARPTALMLAADGETIHGELILRPPSETGEVADLFEAIIRQVAQQASAWPLWITVRYESVAAELEQRLAREGVTVSAQHVLHGLDPLLVEARARMGVSRRLHLPAAPETWAGWGLPARQVAELFRSASEFYRAAPWQLLSDRQVLAAKLPHGDDWLVSVLGADSEHTGLSIIEDVRDLWRRYEQQTPLARYPRYRGPVITLDYGRVDELTPAGREELKSQGWQIAGPEAYPALTIVNTPGGGITRAQADDLIVVLGAVVRFVDTHRRELEADRRSVGSLTWTDPDTGMRFALWTSLLPDGEVDWGVPGELAPGGAVGPNADPATTLDRHEGRDELSAQEARIVARFEQWLVDSGEEAATDYVEVVSTFVESFLVRKQGLAIRAINEYDLRVFLYYWFPQQLLESEKEAAFTLPALATFFSYLAEHEGTECPWATEILSDDDAFARRRRSCPGAGRWKAGVGLWQAQLESNLAARQMMLTRAVDLGGHPGRYGIEESKLAVLLHRQWLLWRDELIRRGVRAPDLLRERLEERTREWVETPRADLDGRTPSQVVAAERAEDPG